MNPTGTSYRTVLLAGLLAAQGLTPPGCVNAQTVTEGRYRLADERQLWHESNNAAGLAHDMRDSTDSRGVACFDLSHRSGDYTRVQEGDQQNKLRFFTERYQKIGRYLYGYGSFDFDMGRTKGRSWSDVMRTYNTDPFISGSAVSGKYDHQQFALHARLASVRFGHLSYGASLDYRVGDLSRLRDPRSRVRMADYRLSPSLTYTTDTAHTMGLAAWYRRYKEKLDGLTTVQEAPSLKYYQMSGMEYALGTPGGYSSYWREYVSHEFGGELSYAFKRSTYSGHHAFSYARTTEYVYGDYKYEPGRWHVNHFGFTTRNRLSARRLLHSIDAAVHYDEGYADQYNQELVTTKDGAYETKTWHNKMTYRKRYQMHKIDADVHYRLSVTASDGLAAYAGVAYRLEAFRNKHLLATSELSRLASRFTLEGGGAVLSQRLWLKGTVHYGVNHRTRLQLSDPTTDYAQGVLLPDMAYYQANYWQAGLELLYLQPLTIKGRRTQWFAKLYGSCLSATSLLDSRSAGIAAGLYY